MYMREFHTTKAISKKFDALRGIAAAHVTALGGGAATAQVDDFCSWADDYALALWGSLLYGNPNAHVKSRYKEIADGLLDVATSPWEALWYHVRTGFGLVGAGRPTRQEMHIREEVRANVKKNFDKLEEYERMFPEAPPTGMRRLSMLSGGESKGPFSPVAQEFGEWNLFGMSTA